MTKEFAVSPAYFDTVDAPPGMNTSIDLVVRRNLVSDVEMDAAPFHMVRFLFAAFCFHYTHLCKNFDLSNRL